MNSNLLKYILLLILVFSVSSCSNKSASENTNNKADIPYVINWPEFLKGENKIKGLSDIADKIEYIRITTPEGVVLGSIRKIAFTKDKIFLLDQSYTIFVFDFEGKFISKFNRVGAGPGEYKYITGFTVDEENNRIAVVSSNKALFYDTNGNFIKEIGVKDYPQSILWLGEDLYVLKIEKAQREIDSATFSALVINYMGDIVGRHRYLANEEQPKSAKIAWGGRLALTTEGVLVSDPYNDTTYLVQKNGNSIPFIINSLDSYRAPREYLQGPDFSFKENTSYILMPQFYLFPGYAFVHFSYKNRVYTGIWDLANKKALSFPVIDSNNGIKDDIDNGLSFLYPRECRDMLADIVEPAILLKNNTIKPKPGSQLEAIMKDLKVDDNPIIRILTTKSSIKANK